MYCDRCGTQLEENVNFCRACGHAVGGASVLPARDNLAHHLRLLGILWIAISAFRLIPALVLFGVARHMHFPPFVQAFLPFIGLLFLASAVLGFVAGWGLLERQSWARILAIVLGILALLDFPIGTALGIYTLWVLLPERPGVPGVEAGGGRVVPSRQ
jgi:hypothetical protein